MAPVLVRGEGARVWDVDGNEFVEYGMGLRSVTLGPRLRAGVGGRRAGARGRGQLQPPDRAGAARRGGRSSTQVPGADMVKFAKNGSDATTAAVKLARAATGRTWWRICRTQPFFSTDDWFIGTTADGGRHPGGGAPLTVGFHYNDLGSVRGCSPRTRGRSPA